MFVGVFDRIGFEDHEVEVASGRDGTPLLRDLEAIGKIGVKVMLPIEIRYIIHLERERGNE